MRLPLLVTLLVGACQSASAPSEPRPPEEVPPPQPSTAQPLEGCSHVRIEGTETWTCGPHRVVRVRYPDGLPPDRPGAWIGEPPQTTPLAVSIGAQALTAQVMSQPELDGDRLVSVLVRDEPGRQIGSCAMRLRKGQDAAGMQAWCAAALGEAMRGE